MQIKNIIWLIDIVEKIKIKHSVSQIEVIEILENKPKFRFVEKGFRKNENVYCALGKTNSGRYLIIFFIYKLNCNAIIIFARDMTKSERHKYEKK